MEKIAMQLRCRRKRVQRNQGSRRLRDPFYATHFDDCHSMSGVRYCIEKRAIFPNHHRFPLFKLPRSASDAGMIRVKAHGAIFRVVTFLSLVSFLGREMCHACERSGSFYKRNHFKRRDYPRSEKSCRSRSADLSLEYF